MHRFEHLKPHLLVKAKGCTSIDTTAGADIFIADSSAFRRQFLLTVGPGDDQLLTKAATPT